MNAFRLNITLKAVGVLALACATSFMFLWNIGSSSISGRSDEVIYVRITQSILHNGDIFPLKHGDVPTYEKPPLKLWLATLAPLVFGESNWSFRLLDGICGMSTIAVCIALSYSMSGSLMLSLLSAGLLLGVPELVIAQHGFRRAVLDGLLSALTVTGALMTWKIISSRRESRWRYVTLGAIWSCAVLAKSVAGIVPAVCSLISIFISRQNTSKRSRAQGMMLVIGLPLLTFSAYSFLLWLCVGKKALHIFLGVEILHRAFSGFVGHNTGSAGFYLWYLCVRAATVPKVLLLSGLIGASLGCTRRLELRFLLVWTVVPVLLYSCAASRVPWYLNPYVPCISLLSVIGTDALFRYLSERVASWQGSRRSLVSCVTTALALIVLAAYTAPPFYRAARRNVLEVIGDTERLPIDVLLGRLRASYSKFAIVENAISGRSNPRRGRFNVEGIYRESLRPHLRIIPDLGEVERRADEVLLVREASVPRLPGGWVELGRIPPHGFRDWAVVAVVYPAT